jgi:hypothetical protein
LDSNHRIQQISITPTVGRQTPQNEFGAVMARTISEVARAGTGLLSVVASSNPVVSAAVSGLTSTASAIQTLGQTAPSTIVPAGVGAGRVATGPLDGTPVTGRGEQWDLMEAQKLLNSQNQSFNLAYMQLQDQMQKESREFNTLTNIMKVRHDSAKAAINNIR